MLHSKCMYITKGAVDMSPPHLAPEILSMIIKELYGVEMSDKSPHNANGIK